MRNLQDDWCIIRKKEELKVRKALFAVGVRRAKSPATMFNRGGKSRGRGRGRSRGAGGGGGGGGEVFEVRSAPECFSIDVDLNNCEGGISSATRQVAARACLYHRTDH